MAPGALEQLLRGLAPRGSSDLEQRVIAGRARNEDAVVVRMPAGKAIVQTVDILAPIVNDAFWFGRIAACNALSDVYALGGQPWCAMNVAFFPHLPDRERPGEHPSQYPARRHGCPGRSRGRAGRRAYGAG